MYEALILFQTYVRMTWRYRWLALIVATLICIGGWTTVYLMPDKYEVSTKVFLDTRSLLRPVLKGLAIDSNIRSDTVLMMRRTLLSRPNLESVARSTDMDLQVNSPEEFEGLLIKLAKNVSITGAVKNNIFDIYYKSTDPKLATRVVEALLNIFVERSLGESRKDTSKTKEFLDQQIREYEAKLEAAEVRLKEFKRRNIGLMPSEGSNYFVKREAVAKQLANAELELVEAKKRSASITAQLKGEKPLLEKQKNSYEAGIQFVSSYDARISSIESNLDSMLLQYTDEYPDIISSRKLLADLKKKRKKEESRFRYKLAQEKKKQQGNIEDSENPVYQELKIALSTVDAEVAGLEARVAEYKRRDAELKKLVDTIPKVEAELKALNRDYGVYRENYDGLVSRRESLKLSDEAGKTTDDVQFNIIEPPRVPIIPVSPNRTLLNSLVLLGGFASGIAVALLIALLRPAFYTREDVVKFVEYPVLGTILRVSTNEENLKRKLGYLFFIGGCFSLVILYIGILYLQNVDISTIKALVSGGTA